MCVYTLFIHMTEITVTIRAYTFVQTKIYQEHSLFKIQSCPGASAERARVRRSRDEGYPGSSSPLQASLSHRHPRRPSWGSFPLRASWCSKSKLGCTFLTPSLPQLLECSICHHLLTSLVSQRRLTSCVVIPEAMLFLILCHKALEVPQAPPLYLVQTKLIIFLHNTASLPPLVSISADGVSVHSKSKLQTQLANLSLTSNPSSH